MIEEEILVLKEIKYKENDKILHALSKNLGKIQILSRGSRKNNSHLINASQLFAYSKCILTKSKNMYIMTSSELIDNFYNLRTNMEAFLYSSYILELVSYISQESEANYRIFEMTVAIFKNFAIIKNNFNKLTAAYELKLVSMLGYKPDFHRCVSCRTEINSSSDYLFSIEAGGIICSKNEISGSGINITYDEIITMESILKSKFENISSLEISNKILKLIRKFLFYYIGKDNFTTLKLL